MSNDNTILDHLNDLTPGARVIADYDVNQKHSNVVWDKMVRLADDIVTDAVGCPNEVVGDHYDFEMRKLEEEILIQRELAGENVRKKNNDFKYTMVSHNSSYRSNKAVIGKAIRAGVALTELGATVPKSKLEKRAKEITAVPVSAYERGQALITKLKNVLNGEGLDEAERDALLKQLRAIED